jgi:hypothetical protein
MLTVLYALPNVSWSLQTPLQWLLGRWHIATPTSWNLYMRRQIYHLPQSDLAQTAMRPENQLLSVEPVSEKHVTLAVFERIVATAVDLHATTACVPGVTAPIDPLKSVV